MLRGEAVLKSTCEEDANGALTIGMAGAISKSQGDIVIGRTHDDFVRRHVSAWASEPWMKKSGSATSNKGRRECPS